MNHCERLTTPDTSHLTQKDFEFVYEPAEDSFLLLDAIEKEMHVIRSLKPSICVEIGCGSGIISSCVSKALDSSCFVMACDINPEACTATRETAAQNHTQVDTVQMDLDTMLLKSQHVDLLFFNPPYVVTPSEEVVQPFMSSGSLLHRAWAGGINGREVLDRLLHDVSSLLSSKSLFYLVVIKENNPDDIVALMTKKGFESDIIITRKVRGEHLIVLKFFRELVGPS